MKTLCGICVKVNMYKMYKKCYFFVHLRIKCLKDKVEDLKKQAGEAPICENKIKISRIREGKRKKKRPTPFFCL